MSLQESKEIEVATTSRVDALLEHSIDASIRALITTDGDFSGERAFVGVGYDSGGTPLDTVTLLLAGYLFDETTVLIADSLQLLNGMSREKVELGARRVEHLVERVNQVYGLSLGTIRASEIAENIRYQEIEVEIEKHLAENYHLVAQLALSRPDSKADVDAALNYAKSELALLAFLSAHNGMTLKYGPSREILYDSVAEQMDISLRYAYARDAYPVNTNKPEPVVHYIARNRGTDNGHRILLEDGVDSIRMKLGQARGEAVEALLDLGTAACQLLGLQGVSVKSRESKQFRKPETVVRDLVMETVVIPLVKGTEWEAASNR